VTRDSSRGFAIGAVVAVAAALTALPVAASGEGSAARPRVEAQRGHAQCPLSGLDERSLLLDNATQWHSIVSAGEVQALGRKVRWGRERVLVHALAQQPTLGVRVSAVGIARSGPVRSPRLDLRITRPAPDELAATALSRPCVFVALTRGAWSEIRVAGGDAPRHAVVRVDKRASNAPGGAADLPRAPLDGVDLVKPAAPPASR
jgi:hypothetical protein